MGGWLFSSATWFISAVCRRRRSRRSLTGLVAVYTMIKTREFVVSTFTGVLTTIMVAAAAFGLHLSSQQIGVGVAVAGAGYRVGSASERHPESRGALKRRKGLLSGYDVILKGALFCYGTES